MLIKWGNKLKEYVGVHEYLLLLGNCRQIASVYCDGDMQFILILSVLISQFFFPYGERIHACMHVKYSCMRNQQLYNKIRFINRETTFCLLS